jgi:hypothetical protein
MAGKDVPATNKTAPKKKAVAKKTAVKAAASKKAQEHVTVEDMHKLLGSLQLSVFG